MYWTSAHVPVPGFTPMGMEAVFLFPEMWMHMSTHGSTVVPGVDAGGGGGEEPPPRCGCGVTDATGQDPLAAVVLLCAGLVLAARRRR